MSSFAIFISGTWQTPPTDAMPVGIGTPRIDGAPIVRRNSPTARSGQGYPVGIDDELFATVGRPVINETGLTWWYDTVGIGTSPYMDVLVRLWDVPQRAWVAYNGVMWAPTYVTGQAGYKITDFQVRFTNLVAV